MGVFQQEVLVAIALFKDQVSAGGKVADPHPFITILCSGTC